MDVEKIDGKKGVRIVENNRYEEIDLLTMRNGFQWSGAPVDRKLLVMVRDAINEFLGSAPETPVPHCTCKDYPGADDFCTAHKSQPCGAPLDADGVDKCERQKGHAGVCGLDPV